MYCSFARRISMHIIFNGEEHMYTSIRWLHVLRALSLEVLRCSHCLELEMLMSMYR
jgi:hypothetical protein